MADAYLTKTEAEARLAAFGLVSASAGRVTDPDLRIASDDLDGMAPFWGSRPDRQERQFPRSGEATIPEGILDWVALRAHTLATNEAPAVKSEGAGRVSVTYANPKPSPNARRMASILNPYLRTVGARADERRRPVRPAPLPYPSRGI